MKHTAPPIVPMCTKAKGRCMRPFLFLAGFPTSKKEKAAGLGRGVAANDEFYAFPNPTEMCPTTQALMLCAARELACSIPELPKPARSYALRTMFDLIYAGLDSGEDQNG